MKASAIAHLLVMLSAFSAQDFAHASEVDNFTARDRLTEDASDVLDGEVNKMIERAVRKANEQSPAHCNRVLLRREILRYGRPAPVSMFELWVSLTDRINQSKFGKGESIYAGHSFSEAPVVWVVGLGKSFNLNGHIVGTDKLGHFFMQGFEYFKKVEEEGMTIEEVVAGDRDEDGIFGILTTGVKSYADLAANYDGYRFWSELYSGSEPYVRCVGGRQWEKARNFRWAQYVDDTWDEAINCSERKPTLQEKVEQNLSRLGSSCPVDPDRCAALAGHPLSQYLISPKCLAAAKPEAAVTAQRSHFSAQATKWPDW